VSGRGTGWADLLGAGVLVWKSKEEKHQLMRKSNRAGLKDLGKHSEEKQKASHKTKIISS
jgi:hypothetical protein